MMHSHMGNGYGCSHKISDMRVVWCVLGTCNANDISLCEQSELWSQSYQGLYVRYHNITWPDAGLSQSFNQILIARLFAEQYDTQQYSQHSQDVPAGHAHHIGCHKYAHLALSLLQGGRVVAAVKKYFLSHHRTYFRVSIRIASVKKFFFEFRSAEAVGLQFGFIDKLGVF